jgi:hypothetical protein
MRSSNKSGSGGRAVVVMPVYKPVMSDHELVSFSQCLKVLGGYDICIVAPEKLDLGEYTKRGRIGQVRFDERYFRNVHGYNRLMLSPWFYESFSGYEYMLVYQLDCFVFRDELDQWCEAGFDYIGAPWIDCDFDDWLRRKKRSYPSDIRLFHRLTRFRYMRSVGNGGFSLRKTGAMVRNLRLLSLRSRYYKGNEDQFISHYLGALNPFFKVPDTDTALRFSFDYKPALAFEMNGSRLPFGCHAWSRKDSNLYEDNLRFWQPHILG